MMESARSSQPDVDAQTAEIGALQARVAELEAALSATTARQLFADGPASGPELTSIILFGADGNLAMKKTYPTLFALWRKRLLPPTVVIIGYARDASSTDLFRKKIFKSIYSSAHTQPERTSFLDRCHYVSGQFNEVSHFAVRLAPAVHGLEAQQVAQFALTEESPERTRIYYLAVPPFLYAPICRSLRESGLRSSIAEIITPPPPPAAAATTAGASLSLREDTTTGDSAAVEDSVSMVSETSVSFAAPGRLRSRFVLEKPFGHDLASCRTLCVELGALVREDEAYRIDHYLGKELVMNVLVLRFANICFEAIWSRMHVRRVEVCCMEQIGTEGRGGYFDNYGIIRDVMQNHLAQILALVAMEQPLSFGADDIRREKIKVLRSVRPLDPDKDLIVGQFDGYTDDETVTNKQSKTETFAAARLHIDNPRWAGVPFILSAGKAVAHKKVEVRITFQRVAGAVPECSDCAPNELVIRVQPDECIYWRVQNRVPGLHRQLHLEPRRMNLLYTPTEHRDMPEAYERLLLEVLRGDATNFVSVDELDAAWAIFTPALDALKDRPRRPERYAFGTEGPNIDRLVDKEVRPLNQTAAAASSLLLPTMGLAPPATTPQRPTYLATYLAQSSDSTPQTSLATTTASSSTSTTQLSQSINGHAIIRSRSPTTPYGSSSNLRRAEQFACSSPIHNADVSAKTLSDR